MMLALLALLPLALAAPPSAHIIGGTEVTSIDRHPWQGALLYMGGYVCGCVMLTPNYVLTAAHCTNNREDDMESFSMRFRSLYHASGGDLYGVSNITIHENYIGVVNDVCILEPDTAITGTGVSIDSNLYENDCWITGWGVDTIGGSVSDVLKEADMDIYDSGNCTIDYLLYQEDVHICVIDNISSAGVQGSCDGDGGSPLVCNHAAGPELRGLASWGEKECSPTYPSVYTRLYNTEDGRNLKEWICELTVGVGGC